MHYTLTQQTHLPRAIPCTVSSVNNKEPMQWMCVSVVQVAIKHMPTSMISLAPLVSVPSSILY